MNYIEVDSVSCTLEIKYGNVTEPNLIHNSNNSYSYTLVKGVKGWKLIQATNNVNITSGTVHGSIVTGYVQAKGGFVGRDLIINDQKVEKPKSEFDMILELPANFTVKLSGKYEYLYSHVPTSILLLAGVVHLKTLNVKKESLNTHSEFNLILTGLTSLDVEQIIFVDDCIPKAINFCHKKHQIPNVTLPKGYEYELVAY